MATLTKDAPRNYGLGNVSAFPVVASDIIYEGAAVGEDGNGYARPLVAGDPFLGFCQKKADNSGGSAGDINVQVITDGFVQLAISGLAITDNDQPLIYASDDNTFTKTSTSNTPIGNVSRYISSGVGMVRFSAGSDVNKVGTAQIVDEAVTLAKMADLARGSLISGQTANNRPTALDAKTDAQILIGDGTDVNSVAMSGDVTIINDGTTTIGADKVDGTNIADDSISVEHLDDGILPSHVVKFAGEYTWTGGGATAAQTVTGALETDIVVASFHTLGTQGTILQGAYVSAADTITYTLDAANTSNDAVISYMVLRAAA
jgi:hypothetical protein